MTPWTAAHHASLSFTVSWSLIKLMPIESMMPSSHLILCHPLLLLPSVFPNIRVFSNESTLHIRGPDYWSFSISPSNKYSGLIFFRIDWFDLLAIQGTLKSLLQHHNLKTSMLRCYKDVSLYYHWKYRIGRLGFFLKFFMLFLFTLAFCLLCCCYSGCFSWKS